MSDIGSSQSQRAFLTTSAGAGTVSLRIYRDDQIDAIRPFSINAREAELVDLRRHILATRWPERETITDASQAVRL